MGNIPVGGSEVFLIYSPEPDAEPVRAKFTHVAAGLAAAYQNNLDRNFASSIQIEGDAAMIYDLESLAHAIDRMNVLRAEAFVNGGNVSVEEVAAQVAREDGHL